MSPVVYASILAQHSRRHGGQGRVIGTLLGTVVGTVVDITNCFPVPHNETEQIVAVDMEFHQTMMELHFQSNPKEVLVGWCVPARRQMFHCLRFATGSAITEHSMLIHEFYQRQCARPVHVLLDTALPAHRLPVAAHIAFACKLPALSHVCSVPIGVPGGASRGVAFTPIHVVPLLLSNDRAARAHNGAVHLHHAAQCTC